MPSGLPPFDKRTPILQLPLPHEQNELHHDLQRITECFSIIDSELPNRIDGAVNQATANLAAEQHAREAADVLLETKFTEALGSESTARQSADNQLAQLFTEQHGNVMESIANEVGARMQADADHASFSLMSGAHDFPQGEVGQILAITKNGLVWVDRYELCEFYFWRHPDAKEGFYPMQGTIIEGAATKHPRAWEKLKTTWGQKLCKTEAEWQAMTRAIWHTNADGSQVGWNGVGGAPFFAPNWDTGALRLPDVRGMYAEAAGFDSLGVGGTHGDAIRKIWGRAVLSGGHIHEPQGSLWAAGGKAAAGGHSADHVGSVLGIDSEKTGPTANKNQPRAWGALACVYLGMPR